MKIHTEGLFALNNCFCLFTEDKSPSEPVHHRKLEHVPTYLELLIFSPALFVYSQGVSALKKKNKTKKQQTNMTVTTLRGQIETRWRKG